MQGGKAGMGRTLPLRVSEVYLSVQGEGPRVGDPTIFVRFGGCNLRCPGWPCDTQHAIDPKYRSEWRKMTPEELYDDIMSIADRRRVNVCFTGGEPFLQPNEPFRQLVNLLSTPSAGFDGVKELECFSNGTLAYPQWAYDRLHFIMDWKLNGSGENPFVPMRQHNATQFSHSDAVKFTIKDREDYDQARAIYETYLKNRNVQIFYGVVWGAVTNEELVGWVLEDHLPWKLNIQIHNYVWDRTRRGI